MSFYTFILQKILFPISNIIIRRKFWRYYKEFLKSQYFNREKIEELQLIKLKKLVKHAYETVPLYKESMDKANVNPEEIKTLQDIKKLPVVTKNDFRNGFPQKCTSNIISKSKWVPDSTSGSTGSPFEFIRDKEFSDYTLANTLRNHTWTGYNVGNKIIGLWGFHKRPFQAQIFEKLIRRKFISSFDVEINYKDYYKIIKNYNPYLIEAYSASVTHFAKLLKQEGLYDLTVPAVISSAETLYPENKKIIEEMLHTKVYNRYGSREVGNIAHECEERKGLHINAESYIVEVVKKHPEDEQGRLIVTNLTNFTMPFIRYDTEDYATIFLQAKSSTKKEQNKICSCGRTLPMLKSVEGRVTDFIILTNGKELSYLFFNYFFEQYGAYLKQFQVIQDKKDHLLMRLVITNKYTDSKEREIVQGIKNKVGKDMNITIEKVDKVEKEKSGKLRPVKRLI